MSAINDLVSHIAKLRFEDLPKEIVEDSKKKILDTLATTIAGSTADGMGQLVNLAKEWDGKKESAIWGYGFKVPAHTAALVNCTMARARDLDDIHERARAHISAGIVPSAFVIAEYSKTTRGKAVNGKELILATTLSADLLCRIRLAGGKVAQEIGWSSETLAPLAVAAMGGKMLGFDETKLLNALGIAYAQCGGNIQCHIEGSLTVRLQQGFGGQAGVLSTILADRGFTGAKDILEGKYGLYPLYMRGNFAPEQIYKELGKRFEGLYSSIKLYPCCRCTHRAIQGALELAKEHNIKADNVNKVTLYTNTVDLLLVGGESKITPKTVPDAQFSYYYTVATVLLKGNVFIDDFTEEAIKNPEVLALAKRVKAVLDPEKDKLESVGSLLDVEIETKDGKRYKKTVQYLKGHPENQLSLEEVARKLADCARFAIKPLPRRNIDKIVQMVQELDKLDDVSLIMGYLG